MSTPSVFLGADSISDLFIFYLRADMESAPTGKMLFVRDNGRWSDGLIFFIVPMMSHAVTATVADVTREKIEK